MPWWHNPSNGPYPGKEPLVVCPGTSAEKPITRVEDQRGQVLCGYALGTRGFFTYSYHNGRKVGFYEKSDCFEQLYADNVEFVLPGADFPEERLFDAASRPGDRPVHIGCFPVQHGIYLCGTIRDGVCAVACFAQQRVLLKEEDFMVLAYTQKSQ